MLTPSFIWWFIFDSFLAPLRSSIVLEFFPVLQLFFALARARCAAVPVALSAFNHTLPRSVSKNASRQPHTRTHYVASLSAFVRETPNVPLPYKKNKNMQTQNGPTHVSLPPSVRPSLLGPSTGTGLGVRGRSRRSQAPAAPPPR